MKNLYASALRGLVPLLGLSLPAAAQVPVPPTGPGHAHNHRPGPIHRAAQHVKQSLQAKMIGYPEYFVEPPLGTTVNQPLDIMKAKANVHDQLLYRTDFRQGTANLSPSGAARLTRMVRKLPTCLGPLVVEWTPEQPLLAEQRRLAIVDLLNQSGVPISPDQIVVGASPFNGILGDDAAVTYPIMINRDAEAGATYPRRRSRSASLARVECSNMTKHRPPSWRGFALATLAATGLAAAGCKAPELKGLSFVNNEPKHEKPGNDSLDTGVVQTEFTGTVAPDQQVFVHLDLGRAYEAQGSIEAAVAEYQKAVKAAQGPQHRKRPAPEVQALAHRRMAAAYDRLGRFTQAEIHYKEALAQAPKDPRIWNDAGYTRLPPGQLGRLRETPETRRRTLPQRPRVFTNLGLCLAAAGRTDEALDALAKAGGPAVGHANLAYLLAAKGQTTDAIARYRQALQLQPTLAPARAALAQLEKAGSPTMIAANTNPTPDPALARTAAIQLAPNSRPAPPPRPRPTPPPGSPSTSTPPPRNSRHLPNSPTEGLPTPPPTR